MAKENRFRKEQGVIFHEKRLLRPAQRKKPASFSIWNDLFHESISFEQINAVFTVMSDNDRHTYQILTKRPERALDFVSWKWEQMGIPWFPKDNIWFGVTVENQATANRRLPDLVKFPSRVKFISAEPLLSEIDIRLWMVSGFMEPPFSDVINWVICGPETGPKKTSYETRLD